MLWVRSSRMTLNGRPMPRPHDEGKGDPLLEQVRMFLPHRVGTHGVAARL